MSNRVNFGNIKEVIQPPNLIDVQMASYAEFLQKDTPPGERLNIGLHAVLREIFPIESYDGKIKLDYISYEVGEPKLTALQSIREGETFSAPLHVTYELRQESGSPRDKVYMGELPIMTGRGTFVINGAERVVVSQLHRSPGVCFERNFHTNGKELFGFRIIPDRGSWLEVQFDNNDLLYVYLDRRRRRRKFLATTFLRVIGFSSDEDIIRLFYNIEKLNLKSTLDEEDLHSKVLFEDIRNEDVVIARAYEPLSLSIAKQIKALGIDSVNVIDIREDDTLITSLKKDPTKNEEEALKEIYRRLRPGDPPTVQNARQLIKRQFFDPKRYDLTAVGRYKINQKLGLSVDSDFRILHSEDFVASIRYLLRLRRGSGIIDDIDHLGSRRVRAVGELLANQCRVGLARTERLVKERMTLIDMNIEEMTPAKLVNPKALGAVVRDFFGRSQLSQFMDQANPLAELTHKRRLSALGPGGLNRDRAGFEVRDVHTSHYGRICPIETPEGPNIGLINSISSYSKINEYGFIESPYRKVLNGVALTDVDYLTADQEENHYIAQANNPIDEKGRFTEKKITVRFQGEFLEVEPKMVTYMDVSPKQLVSVAASLIPFLEHDDANRALMGSNMQRQAVPLLRTDAPIVGTGMETKAARDSRAVVISDSDGFVAGVTADVVVITNDGKLPMKESEFPESWSKIKADPKKGIYVYPLRKFMRSNSGTCINQKPVIRKGDKIAKGDLLADGPCTENGELALGRNMLVAFMPWNGYNFEDAITISQKVVKEDIYTSIHIDDFECIARDTKLGPEEITRDIPNVGDEALRNLDQFGIIRVGAEVKPGDILVGKITPKSETELAPEERLLRAIFGEKAADVKDTSLRVPSGSAGIVMDVKVESRAETDGEKLSPNELNKLRTEAAAKHKKEADNITDQMTERLSSVFLGKKLESDLMDGESGELILKAGGKVTKTAIRKIAENSANLEMEASADRERVFQIVNEFASLVEENNDARERELNRLEALTGQDDSGGTGLVKSVKVYIASKRKLSVGDKMAGRHGNKGVVATIVPEEDMPYLEDGTPVEICLNPLGVPSRMNVGQVLETHLGIAARALGFTVATPVFDGIGEAKIMDFLKQAQSKPDHNWIGLNGKSKLYDGRTGAPIEQDVVVGIIYILKLGHLVADKIHARAVGPYSLVTQQPLGGKAQYGGQRFGEMEVWALEAYGSAYTLQELLTVKSDDVQGRTRIYESIVKGDNTLDAGTPESFNVLIKEMQSLGLDVKAGHTNGVDDVLSDLESVGL